MSAYEQLCTYPSPNPITTLGEGQMRSCSDTEIDSENATEEGACKKKGIHLLMKLQKIILK